MLRWKSTRGEPGPWHETAGAAIGAWGEVAVVPRCLRTKNLRACGHDLLRRRAVRILADVFIDEM